MRTIYGPDEVSGNRTPSRNPLLTAAESGEPSAAILGLLQVCILLGFGRIEQLHVHDGEPVFDPSPTLIRTVRLSDADSDQDLPTLAHILRKPQTRALLRELAGVRCGCILRLEVRDAQPVFMEVELRSDGDCPNA